VATASPPDEVSTALPDDGGGAVDAGVEGNADGEAVVATEVGGGDAGVVAGNAVTAGCGRDGAGTAGDVVGDPWAASLASALFTASWVTSWAELPVMPWPSRETVRRLPVVAVAAPSNQAAIPKIMRLRTLQRRMGNDKSGLRPR
jgi:hypothetical protein